MAFYYTLQGKSGRALECTEKAFESAKSRVQDPGLSAILAFDLCVAYNMAGQCWKLAETASQAIDLIEDTQSQSSLPKGAFNLDYHSALYAYWGEALGYQGDFKEGRRICEKALRLASEKDDRYSLAVVYVLYGYFCLLEGDWHSSVTYFENSIHFQQEIGALIILEKGQLLEQATAAA